MVSVSISETDHDSGTDITILVILVIVLPIMGVLVGLTIGGLVVHGYFKWKSFIRVNTTSPQPAHPHLLHSMRT